MPPAIMVNGGTFVLLGVASNVRSHPPVVVDARARVGTMTDLPYVNVRSPSTTSPDGDGKITGPRRSRKAQWREAPPLPGSRVYGRATPVRLTLTPRIGSELYIEVEYSEGRFWVRHDAGLVDLVKRIQEGGFRVAPPTASTTRRKNRGMAR